MIEAAGLEKAGIDLVAADMPHANKLTIGIMAVMGSARTDDLEPYQGCPAGCQAPRREARRRPRCPADSQTASGRHCRAPEASR
jgi:hypothetical protein